MKLAYALILVLGTYLSFSQKAHNRPFEWESVLPDKEGFSTIRLYGLRDTLANHGTNSLLIIRNDKIVLEWYAPGRNPKLKHYTASLAKALTGGTSLMLALNDGLLKVDDPAWKYIPEWKTDSLRSKITIRQLATHSSGIEDAELSQTERERALKDGVKLTNHHMSLPGWKGGFWRQDPDPFTLSRDQAPVIFTPGTNYQYSNPGMGMLSYAVTASLKGTRYEDIRSMIRDRIMTPIGIREDEWSAGYGKTFEIDRLKLVPNWGGGAFTPRATARIGRLMLNKGNWEGQQLIDSSVVALVTKYAGTPLPPRAEKQPAPASGLCWYTNFDGVWPRAPRDTFLGAGAGNQLLIVIPSMEIIIVRNGSDMFDLKEGEGFYYGVEHYLINGLMEAYNEPPYPMSELIKDAKFADTSGIIRTACGSDNWPMTWADDNHQYTAYGDGWGFEPKVEKKLSLGLARIEGSPQHFKGINIRSGSGEHVGQGKLGEKASSLLMVDKVLYMWVRNVNNAGEHSQLAWSEDHGKSWTYCQWKFTESFGYPSFLNFGKNYENARDDFVYIYSPDENGAYKPADRMVLARVKKDKLIQRSAYEFYQGMDQNGHPVWTGDISNRGAVFANPANCYRSGITYNNGLKRYLWCQTLPHSDHSQGVRFQGGFGIYESPEPWGPWRTVFYIKDWDVGPGETSSMPTKWMSSDGQSCYLVFSGDDCLSIRKVSFEIE